MSKAAESGCSHAIEIDLTVSSKCGSALASSAEDVGHEVTERSRMRSPADASGKKRMEVERLAFGWILPSEIRLMKDLDETSLTQIASPEGGGYYSDILSKGA